MIVECVKVVYLIYQLTTNTNTMATLLKSSKNNILSLAAKIEQQKLHLILNPEDSYLKAIIEMNIRTLEFLKSIKKK